MKIKSLIVMAIVLCAMAACGGAAPEERWGIYMQAVSPDHILSRWYDSVPLEWRNTNSFDAAYRVDVDVSDTFYRTCEYSDVETGRFGPVTFRIQAQQMVVRVILINLETGEQVAENEFIGSPPICPRNITTHSDEDSRTILGDPPSPFDLRRWLMATMPNIDPVTFPTFTPFPTTAPTITVTARVNHTPVNMTPVPEGNTLIVTRNTVIRDENDEPIANITAGRFELLGHTDTSYVISFYGVASYVYITARTVHLATPFTATPIPSETLRAPHTPVNMTPAPQYSNVTITGIVIIRDEHGTTIGQVRSGLYPLVGFTDDAYVILYEGLLSYILQSTRNIRVAVDAGPTATRTPTPTITPTATITVRPPHTPVNVTPIAEGNMLIVTGIIFIRDENDNPVARVEEGSYPLLGITNESYVILYAGHPSYVLLSVTNAHLSTPLAPMATSTPTQRPPHTPVGLTPAVEGFVLIVTDIILIRDEHGATVAQVTDGEYPLVGFTDDAYVILYAGHPSYVSRSTRNIRIMPL